MIAAVTAVINVFSPHTHLLKVNIITKFLRSLSLQTFSFSRLSPLSLFSLSLSFSFSSSVFSSSQRVCDSVSLIAMHCLVSFINAGCHSFCG